MVNKLGQWLLATAAILLVVIFFQTDPVITQEAAAPGSPLSLANIRWPSPPAADIGAGSAENEASFIQIQWPTDNLERQKIRQALHQCLGVSLAKVDNRGDIQAREYAGQQSYNQNQNQNQNYSQYARQFSQPMDAADARLVHRWRELPGQLVRLYPLTLDQQLFSALGLTQQKVTVTARFRWQQNSLMMTNIIVNNQLRPGLITLYRGNPSAC